MSFAVANVSAMHSGNQNIVINLLLFKTRTLVLKDGDINQGYYIWLLTVHADNLGGINQRYLKKLSGQQNKQNRISL